MTHSADWIGRSPAIARVNHAEAERWEDTDWEQIVLLYDMLLHLAPSPVTRLHHAEPSCSSRPTGRTSRTKDITT
jgi:predicted RNA polymerase sigma factor